MEALRKYINNYTDLSENDWQIISDAFERKQVRKNEILEDQDKICRHFYFLEVGIIRFFSIVNGNDITKMFTIAPGCFTSKTSFRYQKPAQESIQAIENSVVWQLSYNKLQRLTKLDSWNDFIKKFVYEVDEFAEEFLMEVKTETAEDRYHKLMERYPTVINRIPLKYLSSFLGIAPQSLSRIRKKIHEKRKS